MATRGARAQPTRPGAAPYSEQGEEGGGGGSQGVVGSGATGREKEVETTATWRRQSGEVESMRWPRRWRVAMQMERCRGGNAATALGRPPPIPDGIGRGAGRCRREGVEEASASVVAKGWRGRCW